MESRASYHFKNYRYSTETKKYYMTCIYCRKELIDSKNTNCKVSHLFCCYKEKHALLTNVIKSFPTKRPLAIKIRRFPTKGMFIKLLI